MDAVPAAWLPLVLLGDLGGALGLSDRGIWVVGDGNGCILLSSDAARVRLLILLERPAAQVMRSLVDAVSASGVAATEPLDLPLVAAVRAGLSSASDYWASLALGWFDVVAPTAAVRVALESVRTATWTSQRTRHRAAAILGRQPH